MSILITGGVGYIGSHIANELVRSGEQVISIDHNPAGNRVPGVEYSCGDFADSNMLAQIFTHYSCDTLIHCAAQIEVGASVSNPALFYQENVAKTITLFNVAREHGVKYILFSSSCAVYGAPRSETFREQDDLRPISPYGETKRVVEQLLASYAQVYDITYLAFRYTNAAGATIDNEVALGEQHEPETHLIPRVLQAAATREPVTIFGAIYNTPDGTCIRDYIHVRDIARAHWKGLSYLRAGGKSGACNLGSGVGSSVQEVIAMVERVTGVPIERIIKTPRAGDPARLVANISRIQQDVGWQPQHNLEMMIHDAWEWQRYFSTAH